jgi:hypothetical protein
MVTKMMYLHQCSSSDVFRAVLSTLMKFTVFGVPTAGCKSMWQAHSHLESSELESAAPDSSSGVLVRRRRQATKGRGPRNFIAFLG